MMTRLHRGAILMLCALASACAPRETIYPLLGKDVPRLREFAPDFQPPRSNESGEVVHGFGGGDGGVTQTPVVFIHGNTVDAGFWLPARARLRARGYGPNEIWAAGYGWNSVRAFDSNDLSVPTLDAFMTELQRYLSTKAGREVRQFDIVAHSLGVTLVRQWMMQTNKFHWVRNFIGACGANHGVWTARPDARGQNRIVSFELAPGSPWLEQLNRSGETPGPTHYMTLYDGSGWGDALFPLPYQHSPALKGAENLAYNLENHTHYDHLELPRVPETLDAMVDFLDRTHEPLPMATPPSLVRSGDLLRADQADALVHCASNGVYPDAHTLGLAQVRMESGALLTCFAHNGRTHLSSAMQRHQRAAPTTGAPSLTLSATPPAGAYEQPLSVTLSASDPAAYIVYTTSGTAPDSGSPLYQAPVYIAAPLRLSAIAITPDGRQSAPLLLDYDISLELIDARHALERQFDADAPAAYASKRKKGH